MVFLDSYNLRVIEGSENQDHYTLLEDQQVYSIELINGHGSRCNATVVIDGEDMGTWRMNSQQRMVLERPANSEKRFTFFRAKTAPSGSGIVQGNSNNGLIEVTFVPEKRDCCFGRRSGGMMRQVSFNDNSSKGVMPQSLCMKDEEEEESGFYNESISNCEAGATALTGHSNQHFGQAGWMELDESKKVVLRLRLVTRKIQNCTCTGVTPLSSVPLVCNCSNRVVPLSTVRQPQEIRAPAPIST